MCSLPDLTSLTHRLKQKDLGPLVLDTVLTQIHTPVFILGHTKRELGILSVAPIKHAGLMLGGAKWHDLPVERLLVANEMHSGLRFSEAGWFIIYSCLQFICIHLPLTHYAHPPPFQPIISNYNLTSLYLISPTSLWPSLCK